jgi:DNA-binding response OmpR family regulator
MASMAAVIAPPVALILAPHDRFAGAIGGPWDRDDAVGVLVVRDPWTFCDRLVALRPAVAVLGAPPADGEHEATTLEERRRRPGLRIVHLSPHDAVGRRLAALRRGFDEALPADIDPDELIGRIRLLEERARTRGAAVLPVAAGIVLDPVAHEVRRGDDRVHLRPKEYQLLAMLAAHPGRAYTRRQLLDRVWGREHDGDPRTVDVHVRWLRAKIEPVPDAPIHLVTVRGVGYRLDPDPR